MNCFDTICTVLTLQLGNGKNKSGAEWQGIKVEVATLKNIRKNT